MKKDIRVYYDEEGDFLEIGIGKPKKGYFRDIGEGLSEKVEEKSGKVIGLAIVSFKKRMIASKTSKNHLNKTHEIIFP